MATIKGAGRELSAAFQQAASVIKKQAPKAILLNVKFTSNKETGSVTLEATDFDITISVMVRGLKIEEDVCLLLPATHAAGVFSKLSEDDIEMEIDGTLLTIRGRSTLSHLNGLPADEFPELPEFDEGEVVEIRQQDFRDMVNRVAYAVAPEALRFALNGVRLVLEGGVVEMVGTDGHRLAYVRRKMDLPRDYPQTIIVPPRGLRLVERLLAEEDKFVELNVLDNLLVARTLRGVVSIKLLEGQYPSFRDVIPTDLPVKLTLPKREFLDALDRAAQMSTVESQGVKFRFTRGMLTMSSRSPDFGDITEDFPLDYDGEDQEITFVARYIQDAVRSIPGDEFRLEIRDSNTACLMRSERDDLALVMPVVKPEKR